MTSEIGLVAAPSAVAEIDNHDVGSKRDEHLMDIARQFEAQFISEYLRHAGVAATPETFGGGFAEQSFSDMLLDEYAREISGKGSFGLAEQIYRSLKEIDQ